MDVLKNKGCGVARKDLFSSLFFLLLSIYVCWQSFELGVGRLSKPGPGFFSFLSGLGLGLLAAGIFFKGLANRPRETVSSEKIRWSPLVITFGSLVGFVLFVNTLGFNLSTFLFITIILRTVGKKTFALSVLTGLSTAFGTYILFRVFLESQLPQGPFGILGF